ncbi:amidohydrolase family protein [Chloroflexota bacterium]
MAVPYPLKIDAFCHIVPPKYKDILYKISPEQVDSKITRDPPLFDLDDRFRIMDKYEPLRQVLTLAWPPLELFADAKQAAELGRLANDEMAELVAKYPSRFVAAIAILPMADMEAALAEADRAINDLHFRGVYIYTPINDKPLDSPEFLPLYEKMCRYDLPIFIHPMRYPDFPDYKTEAESRYNICSTFGWPYETTAAMTRLVRSGIMEKLPNLKIITHHAGGMVPFYADRVAQFSQLQARDGEGQAGLSKDAVDYYKMFYADTALYGNPSGLMCAKAFFGADNILFGTDFPLGCTEHGDRNYRQTINAVEEMDISPEDRKKIYEDNARKLMRLPI